ncbi:MAG: glutamine-synthetase adenylyltransferase, partial [Alphaproteobacteria bacterium]|nr:glutamine-synthetase adenylyltransferase [Alphaproteobacteria bacterium]
MLEPPNIRAIPAASDADAAARGLDDWRSAADGALLDDETGTAVLQALFGNAPFLGQCALHHPESLVDTLQFGPAEALAKLVSHVEEQAAAARTDEAGTMALLRQARRRAALIIGTADVALGWSGVRVTAALSRFAAGALRIGVDHLLAVATESGDLAQLDPAHPGRGSGFVVLGMGKLGGGELNYSSDVDLIVLYDPDITPYRGRRELPDFFVRLTRKLAGLMETPTGDGYVCRVDLRLRPDPSATPPAISLPAAEGYYASLGQNWERAAMIKARPVAGDGDAGVAFLKALRPFMWRKHLDFAAIQDIHSIKRQIHAHKGGAEVAVNGHNVKLGAGGIREIEFFAQTQQLIWGGRYQSLRVRRTEAALHALHALERVTDAEMHELIESYWYLRRVEHRLQMVNDQQTHVLPEDDEGMARIGTFLGYDSLGAFVDHLRGHLERVSAHCGRLFEDAPGLAAQDSVGGNLVFTSGDNDPGTMETLTRIGFRNPAAVSNAIRAWHHGRIPATRSTRSRELLTELVPSMLSAFARTPDPDQAFARFDGFLASLPSG